MILLDPEARPIVAHRGAAGEFPENTILSFQQALAQGADALEFDVRLSADSVPLVIHDPTVDRTTDGRGTVEDLSVRTLEAFDAGAGERIPRLIEVLETFPDTPLIIEVKERRAAAPVAQLLSRCGAGGRVLIGSFERAALRPFDRPGFTRAASRGETARFWSRSRVGWASGGRRYAAFTVPERYASLQVVDARFVQAARRRGKPVHVWTVNDAVTARRLRDLGVAGIITDFPGQVRRELLS